MVGDSEKIGHNYVFLPLQTMSKLKHDLSRLYVIIGYKYWGNIGIMEKKMETTIGIIGPRPDHSKFGVLAA